MSVSINRTIKAAYCQTENMFAVTKKFKKSCSYNDDIPVSGNALAVN